MAEFFSKLKLRLKWISPLHGQNSINTTNSTNPTIGKVYAEMFELPVDTVIDQIIPYNGTAVSGNFRVGIYGPVTTEDCAGAALLYDSGDIVQTGTSQSQTHVLSTPLALKNGRYYVVSQYDNTISTYFRLPSTVQITGWTQTYDRSGGYGAFTNPAPAMTNTASAAPQFKLRCSN